MRAAPADRRGRRAAGRADRPGPANANDEAVLPDLLAAMPAVQGPRGRPRRKPGTIFGDRAYGTAAMVALVALLGIFSCLAPRAGRVRGSGLGRFRYVVERSLANFGQFRRIKFCHEREPAHFQALNATIGIIQPNRARVRAFERVTDPPWITLTFASSSP